MSPTSLLKKIWVAIYDTELDVDETFEQYFHKNYSQSINGIYMNRIQYRNHALEQRKSMKINSIDYKHIIEKENELFALYYPKGVNSSNKPIKAEVIAYFQFEDQKLIKIHGQVQLIEGELADVDMKK